MRHAPARSSAWISPSPFGDGIERAMRSMQGHLWMQPLDQLGLNDASSVTDISSFCRQQKAHEDCNSRRAETAPVTNETDRQKLQRLDWNCAVLPGYPTRTTFCDPGKRQRALDRQCACSPATAI